MDALLLLPQSLHHRLLRGPAGWKVAGDECRSSSEADGLGESAEMPIKQAIDELRRGDKETSRGSTNVRPYRISGILARTFEISETRRLPADQAPSLEDEIHHYVAVIPSGESYYIIKLSSTRDIYLEYRELFVRFLRSFKPMGYK